MDNFYKDKCPPRMEDGGRHLGDYQTATRRNEHIKYFNNIVRDDQYRLFLQKNGQSLINNEWNYHKTHNNCHLNSCYHTYPLRSTNRQMAEEKHIYDEFYGKGQNFCENNIRTRCTQYQDYRLN